MATTVCPTFTWSESPKFYGMKFFFWCIDFYHGNIRVFVGSNHFTGCLKTGWKIHFQVCCTINHVEIGDDVTLVIINETVTKSITCSSV